MAGDSSRAQSKRERNKGRNKKENKMTLIGNATREDVEDAELNGGKVYVGNIKRHDVKSEQLENDFKEFGELLQVWVAKNPSGFAYVTYRSAEDALDAVQELNGKMSGERD